MQPLPIGQCVVFHGPGGVQEPGVIIGIRQRGAFWAYEVAQPEEQTITLVEPFTLAPAGERCGIMSGPSQ